MLTNAGFVLVTDSANRNICEQVINAGAGSQFTVSKAYHAKPKALIPKKPMTTNPPPKYFETRKEWRQWLSENFDTASEIWFVFPNKSSNKKAILYNDAVEEALCFGWIDSIVKSLDKEHQIQRFTPRRAKSPYSQPNKERLKWLLKNEMVHPKFVPEIQQVLSQPFLFPEDIMNELKADKTVWDNYQKFSDSYQRIRIAYIDGARKRPEEFKKRLHNFMNKTKENKIIGGFGGVEKYY